jgi:hypothetical protein
MAASREDSSYPPFGRNELVRGRMPPAVGVWEGPVQCLTGGRKDSTTGGPSDFFWDRTTAPDDSFFGPNLEHVDIHLTPWSDPQRIPVKPGRTIDPGLPM